MAKEQYFNSEFFSFLSDLQAHNERSWFIRNKGRYEAAVRDPALRFIAAVGPRLAEISPYFMADARPVGGSLMRIYRDIRFSKDKAPYKTSIAMHFHHKDMNDGSAPAFYLRLESSGSVAGGGVWQPDTCVLKAIRYAIATNQKKWVRAVTRRRFKTHIEMVGRSLKRPPVGYDGRHPCIDDIRRKDFAVSAPLRDVQVASSDFMSVLLGVYRTISPFMQFLSEAQNLRF